MGIYIYLSNSCLLLGYSFQWIKPCAEAQLKFKEIKERLEFVWLKLTWTGREGIKTMLLSMALSWLPGERCRNQILLFLNAVSPVSQHIHSQQCQRVLWWLWCGWGRSWTKGRCPNSAELCWRFPGQNLPAMVKLILNLLTSSGFPSSSSAGLLRLLVVLCIFSTVTLSSCTHEYKIGHYFIGKCQMLEKKYTFKT